MAAEKAAVTGGDPTPILTLLTALRRAVDAGVDRDKISTMLEMSMEAATSKNDGKPKQQSPIFKNCAGTLDRYSDAVVPEDIVQHS